MNGQYYFLIVYAIKDNDKPILLYGYLIPYHSEQQRIVSEEKLLFGFCIKTNALVLSFDQFNQITNSLHAGYLELANVIDGCTDFLEFYSKKQVVLMNDRRPSSANQSLTYSVSDTDIFYSDINISSLNTVAKENLITTTTLISKLFEILDKATSLNFSGKEIWQSMDSARLGCLEVHNLRLLNDRQQFLVDIDNHKKKVTIQKSYNKSVQCNVILFDQDHIILDEILNLNSDDSSKAIEYQGDCGSYELKVYSKQGILIYQEAFVLLKQVGLAAAAIFDSKRIDDKLSKRANSVSKDYGNKFQNTNSQYTSNSIIGLNNNALNTNRSQLLELLPVGQSQRKSFYFHQGNRVVAK